MGNPHHPLKNGWKTQVCVILYLYSFLFIVSFFQLLCNAKTCVFSGQEKPTTQASSHFEMFVRNRCYCNWLLPPNKTRRWNITPQTMLIKNCQIIWLCLIHFSTFLSWDEDSDFDAVWKPRIIGSFFGACMSLLFHRCILVGTLFLVAILVPFQRSWLLSVVAGFEITLKVYYNNNLGGGFKHFLFSSLLGQMIQFD